MPQDTLNLQAESFTFKNRFNRRVLRFTFNGVKQTPSCSPRSVYSHAVLSLFSRRSQKICNVQMTQNSGSLILNVSVGCVSNMPFGHRAQLDCRYSTCRIPWEGYNGSTRCINRLLFWKRFFKEYLLRLLKGIYCPEGEISRFANVFIS